MANTQKGPKDVWWSTFTGHSKKERALTGRTDVPKKEAQAEKSETKEKHKSAEVSKLPTPDQEPAHVSTVYTPRSVQSNNQTITRPLFTLPNGPIENEVSRNNGVDIFFRRAISLSGFEPGTLVSTIMSFVRGGPLEKILDAESTIASRFVRPNAYKKSPYLRAPIFVFFMTPQGANNFMAYATNNALLTFNGLRIQVAWANDKILLNEELDPHVAEDAKYYSASRVIVLSHPINKTPPEPLASRKININARENYTRSFSCESLKRDFAQFGQIIDVTPVCSSKLSVCIQFADIRSAMLSMRTLNENNSVMRAKYSLWRARYVRDVTCRPCYPI